MYKLHSRPVDRPCLQSTSRKVNGQRSFKRMVELSSWTLHASRQILFQRDELNILSVKKISFPYKRDRKKRERDRLTHYINFPKVTFSGAILQLNSLYHTLVE